MPRPHTAARRRPPPPATARRRPPPPACRRPPPPATARHRPPSPHAATRRPLLRLDRDTSGMLVFGTDGGVQSLLLFPTSRVWKTYTAELAEGCAALLPGAAALFRSGFRLEDGLVCAPAELELLGDSTVRVKVHEGHFHQVCARPLLPPSWKLALDAARPVAPRALAPPGAPASCRLSRRAWPHLPPHLPKPTTFAAQPDHPTSTSQPHSWQGETHASACWWDGDRAAP